MLCRDFISMHSAILVLCVVDGAGSLKGPLLASLSRFRFDVWRFRFDADRILYSMQGLNRKTSFKFSILYFVTSHFCQEVVSENKKVVEPHITGALTMTIKQLWLLTLVFYFLLANVLKKALLNIIPTPNLQQTVLKHLRQLIISKNDITLLYLY